jgi:hypothetical protein
MNLFFEKQINLEKAQMSSTQVHKEYTEMTPIREKNKNTSPKIS